MKGVEKIRVMYPSHICIAQPFKLLFLQNVHSLKETIRCSLKLPIRAAALQRRTVFEDHSHFCSTDQLQEIRKVLRAN